MNYLSVVSALGLLAASPSALACSDVSFSIKEDELEQFEDEMNTMYRENQAPIKMDAIEYSFEGNVDSIANRSARVACHASKVEAITAALIGRRFSELSKQQMARAGIDKDMLGSTFRRTMPYGLRDQWEPGAIDMKVFMAEPACARRGGAISAYLFIIRPAETNPVDLGSVAVSLAGVGSCSTYSMDGVFVEYTWSAISDAVHSKGD